MERTCLKCGKLFPSTGPGNRICSVCSRAPLPRLRVFTPTRGRRTSTVPQNEGDLGGQPYSQYYKEF